ncbi:MAG: 6-phosphofructokinase, partial [Rhodospirillales bacterium]|nr:6-phosphofructokinase [Rhodospirillales bacterium]
MTEQSRQSGIKRIGVLTSGGDCSGLNAVIRSVVYRATETYGWQVYGIRRGTLGLMERPVLCEELNMSHFRGHMLRMGGTMLGTWTKGNPYNFPMPDGSRKDRSDEFFEGYKKLELDALIGVGGDGSLKLLSQLSHKGGIGFVGIPKTID